MDEVFGSENFFALINFKSMSPLSQKGIASVYDYVIWYAKNKEEIKFRPLYKDQDISEDKEHRFLDDEKSELGYRKISEDEFKSLNEDQLKKIFRRSVLTSSGFTPSCMFDFQFNGAICKPFGNKSWRTTKAGVEKLITKKRIFLLGKSPYFKQYHSDFPLIQLDNSWSDTAYAQGRDYVVQTGPKVIQRCILMTTDPGDLVLDPTCGSGTTAFVAEQWGRRWITIDTSRIALNIAKTRLMTATFPYYELYDQQGKDIRQGFIYKTVAHITLKSLANDEPAEEETLYDQPKEDKKKLRVTGPFTVETLQNFEPVSPDALDNNEAEDESIENFEDRIFEHLKSAGVKNGIKNENAVFKRIERKSSAYLNAEGFYDDAKGKERKAYFHIGPKFGTVSKQAVNEAVKECRVAGDADWLIILGFSFEADISNQSVTTSAGSFEVTKVRMHDDLMQEGLLKKDKKAASFVTIGEPDIKLNKKGNSVSVEIQGLDIYDPIKDEVKARSVADIAYWMLDDDYDSSNFILKQIFFCGGDKDEFDKWKKGLSSLAKDATKAKAQNTLRIELDDDAWDRLYGFQSHPIEFKKGRKIAVRVISQFGEESMKVIAL
ncbi:MAG: DNA methyltransferase, partial [Flavisolibacter sp.]